MSAYAFIIGDAEVQLWGLGSRERIRRLLQRAGIDRVVDDLRSVPPGAGVILIRADHLYEPRTVRDLSRSPATLLQVEGPEGSRPVAAHVSGDQVVTAHAVLTGVLDPGQLQGVRVMDAGRLSSGFDAALRKSAEPMIQPIEASNQDGLEEQLFSGAYKGVTDLVTKWWWPTPARYVTRWCTKLGVRPNHVTVVGLSLVILAGVLFAYGQLGWGLAAAWLMTFLDTVDGKLARVTVTSSRLGHILDHGIDMIHPPFWYLAWGMGLQSFAPGIPGLDLEAAIWLIFLGYIAGRLAEGGFQLWFGRFGIFCWRPFDSYFRLITARRNPNLILLTLGLALGRPDLGLAGVMVWTLVSSAVLLLRLVMAWWARRDGPLQSWLAAPDTDVDAGPLAARLFAGRTTSARG